LLFNIFDATTTFDILQLGHVQKKSEEEKSRSGENRCQQSAKPTTAAAEKQLRVWLSIQTVYNAHRPELRPKPKPKRNPWQPSEVKYTPC